jgi:hypothetical protein
MIWSPSPERLLLPASHELPGLKEGIAELEQMVQ